MEGDSYSLWVDLLIILSAVFASAFFSGMEIAFVSIDQFRLGIERRKNDAFAKKFRRLTKRGSWFITTMLIGNNVSLVIYGLYSNDIVGEWMSAHFIYLKDHSLLLLMAKTGVTTFVILLLAEYAPKVFFKIHADQILRKLIIPAYVCYLLFYGPTLIIIIISNLVMRLMGIKKSDKKRKNDKLTKVMLAHYIESRISEIKSDAIETEIQIFRRAFFFKTAKAKKVMIPVANIVAVDKTTDLLSIQQLFISNGLSKILVYHQSIHQVVGYVKAKDFLKEPQAIDEILVPKKRLVLAHEETLIEAIFQEMTDLQREIALVFDTQNQLVGMITMEDIVEELLGEIEDEHDRLT